MPFLNILSYLEKSGVLSNDQVTIWPPLKVLYTLDNVLFSW